MANENASSRMAHAIEQTRRRIAECERRIARLEAIGASTWTSKQFLESLQETLALQHYLQALTRSYSELASLKLGRAARPVRHRSWAAWQGQGPRA